MIKKAHLQELLPVGEQARIAKATGYSSSLVQYHIGNDLQGNTDVSRRIREYIEEHFPEILEGDYVYVLTTKDSLGMDAILAVCTSREEAEKIIRGITDYIPLEEIMTRKVAVDEITPTAKRLFFEKHAKETPLSSVPMDYGRASATLKRILADLGCRTLEDVAEIPIDVIMSQKGANARTKFMLRNLFIENKVPYNTEDYTDI